MTGASPKKPAHGGVETPYFWPIDVDIIDVPAGRRIPDAESVAMLAASIKNIGLRTPIAVRSSGTGTDSCYVLVTGAHRLAAVKSLGWETIDCFVLDSYDIDDDELWEIAENLHRAELTALERSNQIARWAELTTAKVAQSAPPGGCQPKEKGIRKVASDLGIDRRDAERAVKVASLSDEAKQAARDAGLDNNRSALLAVAEEVSLEAQIARVARISEAKVAAKAAKRKGDVVAFPRKQGGAVRADPLIDPVGFFAEFCKTNSPVSAAVGVQLNEVGAVQNDLAVIEAWLGRFAVQLAAMSSAATAPAADRAPRLETAP